MNLKTKTVTSLYLPASIHFRTVDQSLKLTRPLIVALLVSILQSSEENKDFVLVL
jgi:hypothetical protein